MTRPAPFSGSAADFDGAEFVGLPLSVVNANASPITIALRVKFDATDGLRLAFSGVDHTDFAGSRIYLGVNNGAAYGRAAGNDAIEGGALTTTDVHHLALAVSPAATVLYVDGVAVGSSGGRSANPVSHLSIGAYTDHANANGTFFVDGQVFDVEVYHEVLDAAAIAVLAAPPAGPWPANVTAPTIAQNGRTLQLDNAGVWTNSPASIVYQWQRDGEDVAGQTGLSYAVPDANSGAYRLVEIAGNADGTASAASNAINVAATSIGVVSLVAPVDHQTFQRLSESRGSIYYDVTGSEGESAEVRFTLNGSAPGGWTPIGSFAGGAIAGELVNQPVGRGIFEVRLVSTPSVIDSAASVGVGDVFVGAGQSNSIAEGRHNASQSYAATSESINSSVFDEAGAWGPVTTGYQAAGGVPNASSDYSIVPRLAGKFEALLGVPIGFVLVGEGGTRLNFEWTPAGGRKYGDLIATYNAANTYGYRAVLWDLGESDAIAASTRVSFESGLNALISSFRIATSTPDGAWVVAITGTTPGGNTLDEIRSAQAAVIAADEKVYERAIGGRSGLHWGEGSSDDSVEDEQLAQLWVDSVRALLPAAPLSSATTWWSLTLDDFLVCRWMGDGDEDGSADPLDYRRRANARWNGDARYTTGPFDHGAAFLLGAAGVLQTGEIASAPVLAESRTICFWISPESDGQNAGLLAYTKGDGEGSRLNLNLVGNEIEVDFGGHRLRTTGASLPAGRWRLVTVVIPESATWTSDTRVFVDALEQVITTAAGAPVALATAPVALQIGGNADQSNRFDGAVWDIRIYRRELADAEIAEILDGPEPTLVDAAGVVLDDGSLLWAGAGSSRPTVWDTHWNGGLEVTAEVFRDGVSVASGLPTDPLLGASLDVHGFGQGAYEVVLTASNAGGTEATSRARLGPVIWTGAAAAGSTSGGELRQRIGCRKGDIEWFVRRG